MIKNGFVIVHGINIDVTEWYGEKSNLYNTPKLLLEHPCKNLDSSLFETKTYETTLVSNTEIKYDNHKEESLPRLLEIDCSVGDANNHIDFQLPLRQAKIKKAKINFWATLKVLYDLCYLKKNTEKIKTYTKAVNSMVRQSKQNMKSSKILFERNSVRNRKLPKLKTVKKKIKRLKSEPKQLFNENINQSYFKPSRRISRDDTTVLSGKNLHKRKTC